MHNRRHLTLTATALTVLLSCDGGQREDAQPASRPPLPTIESPSAGVRQIVREPLDALEPEKDGWPSEAFADEAGKSFHTLGRLLTENAISAKDVRALLGDSFSSAALRPASLEESRVGSFPLRRMKVSPSGVPPPPRHTGPAGFAEALSSLTAPYGTVERVDFQVVDIADNNARRSTVLFEAVGHTESARIQQNATWVCDWSTAPGTNGPRLAAIDLEDYREVVLETRGQKLFADCTESALGGNPCYRDQLSIGQSDWARRVPSVLGSDFSAHCGLAVGDADGDGLDDLYLCQPGALPNRLLLHQGDGTVVDHSAQAGVDFLDSTRSALFADLDNDGDQDLAVGMTNRVAILRNDGSARFAEAAVLECPAVYSLAAADYDGDRLVDLFVCAYGVQAPVPFHDADNGAESRLFHNDGDLAFTDAIDKVGIGKLKWRFSIAAAWEDYDGDADLDLYVVNDYGRNCLYRNDGESFTEVGHDAGAEDPGAGRSITWGDADRDGRVDLYISRIFSPAGCRITTRPKFLDFAAADIRSHYERYARGNSLYTGTGATFIERSAASGASRAGSAWDAKFVDLDNDGWEDLLVVNGDATNEGSRDLESFYWRQFVARSPVRGARQEFSKDYQKAWMALTCQLARGDSFFGRERNRAFLNLGSIAAAGTPLFADVSGAVGFDFADDGRSIGLTDWDADGDVDAWIASRSAPRLRFLRNDQTGKLHFLSVRLEGRTCNRDAIGARVELTVPRVEGDNRPARQMRTLRAGEGFLSQSSKWLHFGLGNDDSVERLVVSWPDRTTTEYRGLEVDRRYVLVQGDPDARPWNAPPGESRLRPSTPAPPPPGEPDRAVAATRVPLPVLTYKSLDGTSATLDPDGPVLVYLWGSDSPSCLDPLREVARTWSRFEDSGLEVIALNVDAFLTDRRDGTTRVNELAKTLPSPLRIGVMDAALLGKLELLCWALFDDARPLRLGASVLADAEGDLAVVYRTPVTLDRLADDLKLCAAPPAEYVEKALPYPGGRWHRPPLAPVVGRGAPSWAALAYDLAGHKEEAARCWKVYLRYFDKVPIAADPERATREKKMLAKILAEDVQRWFFREQREKDGLDPIYRALELWPDWVALWLSLGDYLRGQGRLAEALEAYRGAFKGEGSTVRLAKRRAAWILCASDDDHLRDARAALALAKEVCEETKYEDFGSLDVLAAAYAELGEFDEAIAWATKASDIATRRNAGTMARHIGRRLEEFYRNRKPYRGLGGIND